MKEVTKDQFDAFLSQYPRPLQKGVDHTLEPPLVYHYDVTLGEWPDYVVAAVKIDDEERVYMISEAPE